MPKAARCAPETVDLVVYPDTRLAIGGETFGLVSPPRACLADEACGLLRLAGQNLGWGCTLEVHTSEGTARMVHHDDVLSYTDASGAIVVTGTRWTRTGNVAVAWPTAIHVP